MKDEVGELRDLKLRTKEYAVRIIKLCATLHSSREAETLGRQLIRSGTSVGAHYREAKRSKSDADFVSKIEGALQELDESDYWIELLIDAGFVAKVKLEDLLKETNELIAILTTIAKKVKVRKQEEKLNSKQV